MSEKATALVQELVMAAMSVGADADDVVERYGKAKTALIRYITNLEKRRIR